MTEASSVTTFVVGDRLPWPDDASAVLEKGPFDAGVVHDCGARQQCSILKISALGATLRGDLAKEPGEQISLELSTGQRPAATIAWAKSDEFGVSFNEPVDVLALINRQLVSQPGERRAMPRVEVRCALHIKFGEHLLPATLRNISSHGLQLEGDQLPECGTYVAVFVEGLIIPPGEVVWRRGDLAGVEVFEELSWSSIIPWIRGIVRRGTDRPINPR